VTVRLRWASAGVLAHKQAVHDTGAEEQPALRARRQCGPRRRFTRDAQLRRDLERATTITNPAKIALARSASIAQASAVPPASPAKIIGRIAVPRVRHAITRRPRSASAADNRG
jgi:hypothetical protein